eukprot:TRINITY_DN880_c0_g1_i1.p1 TRINITY_DN880_c0_g1~~TRINITY_DN880_c0_g1_i1.p1  ORF type:complete len:448 (-),score=13.77 TRINITY_DN880_c0_g1_i1:268-1611(-)
MPPPTRLSAFPLLLPLLVLFASPLAFPPRAPLASAATIKSSQEAALLNLKKAWGYFVGTSTWGAGKDCSKWARVNCSSKGDVLRLNMTGSGIRWTGAGLPAALQNLTSLEMLRVGSVGFVASLPSYLSTLTKLTYLDISNNTFYGSAAPIWSLTKLTYLDVSSTLLRGQLPTSLGLLTNLAVLNVSDTYLSGSIPDSYSNLVKLQYSHFDRCFFTALPASFPDLLPGNLTFSASGNLISSIPITFPSSASSVYSIDLALNSIATLPTEIALMTDLSVLRLGKNQIATNLGDVAYSDLVSLRGLYLGGNLIADTIPATFSELVALQNLDLAANQITSSLPDELTTLTDLVSLDVSSNQMDGDLPLGLNDLPSLLRLVVSYNGFTGPLPQPTLGANSKFYLDARNNSFTGSPKVKGICPNARPTKLLVTFNCLDLETGCVTKQRTDCGA